MTLNSRARRRAAPHQRATQSRRRKALLLLWRTLSRLLLWAGIAAAALYCTLAIAATAPPPRPADAAIVALPIARPPVWSIDLDGDGVADLANPTHGKIRGEDRYGSGKFGAGRDHGHRRHEGADFVAAPGSKVAAPLGGVVTAIADAYDGQDGLRFIEIRNKTRKLTTRVFYVDPRVVVGQTVAAGDIIGVAESLAVRYPNGITNHVHVELRDARGVALDPARMLPLGAPSPDGAAAAR